VDRPHAHQARRRPPLRRPARGYEYELDGYRAAMRIAADGTTALTSRNDLDLTAEFAELAGVLTAAL
jgi:bifunctional non-homologous end joining protein LigD